MAVDLPSRKEREQFFPVHIRDGEAMPVGGVSGSFQTLLGSDGIIKVPIGKELLMNVTFSIFSTNNKNFT